MDFLLQKQWRIMSKLENYNIFQTFDQIKDIMVLLLYWIENVPFEMEGSPKITKVPQKIFLIKNIFYFPISVKSGDPKRYCAHILKLNLINDLERSGSRDEFLVKYNMNYVFFEMKKLMRKHIKIIQKIWVSELYLCHQCKLKCKFRPSTS